MADRTVSVSLRANVASFMASMSAASKSADDFATRNRAQMEQVGQGLLGMGAAAVAGLGLATKAAIDWESAWAGVTKTVEGSEAQMSALEQDLRDMAKELPASHQEIAAVAEAAGQLGVGVDDVSEFTRVMIDLGQTTNISAEEAGTALARLMNVMGTSQEDVDRLGSAVVALGNNAETTEAEIVSMATRLSAAGALVGATESDILGLATAMSSVGIRAELGGGAMSRVLQEIYSAAQQGGEAVQGFADVAGMSANEFQTAFGDDPVQALVAFVEGLNGVEQSGGNVVGVLDDLGFKGTEDQRVLLSLKGASDVLTDSLNLGATAWEENSALTEEAQKRYETASAQISMAWNSIKDAAIEVGSVVLPLVAQIADGVGDLADAFGALPEGADVAVAAVLGIGGALSLAGGGMLLLLPRIAETKAAMQTLGLTTGKTGTAMRGLGTTMKGLGIAGLAFGISSALKAVADEANKAEVGVGEMSNALADLRRGRTTEAIDTMMGRIESMADRSLFETVVRNIDGVAGALSLTGTDSEKLANEIEVVDEALMGLVQGGDIDLAEQSFKRLAEEWEAAGGDADDLIERFPRYQDALERADAEQKNTADSADELGGELDQQKTSAEEAMEALQEYQDQLRAMTDPVFALFDALDQVETAQKDYNTAVDEHGKNSDEAQAASIRYMQALEGLEQAAIDGDLSFNDFSARLDKWVERGDLTEKQAAGIRDRVKEARGEAEDFQGDYKAQLKAEQAGAVKEHLRGLIGQLEAFTGTHTATVHLGATGMDVGRFFGAAGMQHDGGLIMHDGGFVGAPRMHSGGIRGDERRAILQRGEFVVQAPAVQSLGMDAMRQINQGQVPGGGGVTVQGPLIGEVKTLSGDRFSLPELENDLRFSGAA